ncbi:General alpha-glucoside permease [Cladophialophora carrionii]|uniref:General alpha-glucoside permease n=1 Tax=Cladophialophora carrionii TaxID=86049 RepID=A0A1C1CBJ6_9EURO|nr:General alpha-glucoside permease [Cladophialophora carrionii]
MSRSDQGVDRDERSPLIRGARRNDDIGERTVRGKGQLAEEPYQPEDDYFGHTSSDAIDLEGSESVENKSSLYLILLTVCIGGLQIVWSVELSNGSPYLLSLGMSKALLAFVWLAGPLTGVLVQPYVGIKSDRCRISWGKRKPFMLAGTLGTIAASMILAYARDIVRVTGRFDADAPYVGGYKVGTIILATVMMWCLDFSINTVQAAIRAFIVDNAPSHQQESANAWASRMNGLGNVLGYLFGYLNLPRYFHFFGNTQFKVLVVLASIALSSTVLVSILSIKERNPQLDPPSRDSEEGGILAFFRQVFSSMRRLPPQIRKVCEIQFFHWIGWFPFLFYITTWIGQLYVNPHLKPGMSDTDVERLWGEATRIGTLALLIYAVVSFMANIILPFLVVPSYKPQDSDSDTDSLPPPPMTPITPTTPIGARTPATPWGERPPMSRSGTSQWKPGHRPRTLSRSQTSLSINRPLNTPGLTRLHNTPGLDRLNRRERSETAARWLTMVQIPGLTLRRAWLLAQLLFAGCMWSTLFISTPFGGSIMVALVGISWSLSLWAPFALISGEIAKREERRRKKRRARMANGQDADEADDKEKDEEDQAGIILGLHNVALSAPQVLATLISSAIFKLLQKPRNEPGDTSVGWTLRVGGLAVLVAVFITSRMKEPGDETEDEVISP